MCMHSILVKHKKTTGLGFTKSEILLRIINLYILVLEIATKPSCKPKWKFFLNICKLYNSQGNTDSNCKDIFEIVDLSFHTEFEKT